MEERSAACLRELEAVLAHESMSLLQPTQPIQSLAMEVDVAEAEGQVEGETPTEGGEQREGAWGAQLFGLQRAQLVRQLRRSRLAPG